MHLVLLLLSVATVASSPPGAQPCDAAGPRIGSIGTASPQACRAAKDRRVKACTGRACDRD